MGAVHLITLVPREGWQWYLGVAAGVVLGVQALVAVAMFVMPIVTAINASGG